jgi:hypothetical protein
MQIQLRKTAEFSLTDPRLACCWLMDHQVRPPAAESVCVAAGGVSCRPQSMADITCSDGCVQFAAGSLVCSSDTTNICLIRTKNQFSSQSDGAHKERPHSSPDSAAGYFSTKMKLVVLGTRRP